MADEKTEVVDELQAEKDFAAGFTAPSATVTPPKTDDTPAVIDAPAAVVEDTPIVPPVAEPEYVKITKAEFETMQATLSKVGDFDKKFDRAFGTVGGLQDIVKQLQNSTPKGEAVVLDDALFAPMAEDYPDLAKHQRTILEKVLKGTVGTGTSAATVDPAVISKMVADGIKAKELEQLVDEYPDWMTIVGAVDSPEKADPNNPFRKWLGTQPADYSARILSSHSAPVLAKAIAKFKEATKALPPPPKTVVQPTPKEVARRANLKAAIPPKGEGNPAPKTKTADDEFNEGYNQRSRTG